MLVLDCGAAIDVEYSAIRVPEQLDEQLRRNDCELWFAGMTQAVLEVVEHAGIAARIGRAHMFHNLPDAVASTNGGRFITRDWVKGPR